MVKKSEFIWNSIASLVASMLNAVLLLFCTRINGTDIAGMFSIAFATSVILNAIGDYGIRIYQVTDSERKYKFGEYVALRIVVVLIMLAIGIAFVFISGYDTIKLLVTILLILFRIIDNLSETYQGEFQVKGRLDLGAKSVVIRNGISIIMFLISDIITKNIIISCTVMFLTNLLIFLLFDIKVVKKYNSDKVIFTKEVIVSMLKECFPVFLSTILSLYITNAVKYAIDEVSTYEMQTFYNIIYLPTFTINLASIFIIKPLLKVLGDIWKEKKYKEMVKIMIKVSGIILVVTMLVEIVCFMFGTQILGLIYGVELNQYKIDLCLLVLSGGIYALTVLLLYILTTMRNQKNATIAYLLTSVFALIIPRILVEKYNMFGATLSNLFITFILFVLLVIPVWTKLNVIGCHRGRRNLTITEKQLLPKFSVPNDTKGEEKK